MDTNSYNMAAREAKESSMREVTVSWTFVGSLEIVAVFGVKGKACPVPEHSEQQWLFDVYGSATVTTVVLTPFPLC